MKLPPSPFNPFNSRNLFFLFIATTAFAADNPEPWALKPIQRPTPPAIADKRWSRNPIDNFIYKELADSKLSPSPEAPRRILIRRLYFDLIGLPPSYEEVRAFEQDRSSGAYEKIVERLLASPRYGERWAQHWLDVVRFAESHGFEMNQPRPNAWRYRDYVIKAFNDDKSYARFILEQLAGDVLGEDAATGFLVAGPWDQVKSPDPVLTAAQRADELHDMVSVTSSAFLGMTVGCARCHNHKFDPIPQVDYYAIKACLSGVQHGERKLRTPDAEAREREAEACRKRLATIEDKLTELEPLAKVGEMKPSLRAPVSAQRNVDRFAPVSAKFLRFTITRTTDAEPCIDELEVYDNAGTNVALANFGTKARASSVFPNSEIHRLEHLNDGKYGNSHSWISNERGKGWVELEFPKELTITRVIWGRDREQKFSDRLALDYRIETALDTNHWSLVTTSQDRVPYSGGRTSLLEMSVSNPADPNGRANRDLLAQRADLETRVKQLTDVPMVYAGTMVESPEPIHRLQRGDPMQKRELIEPGSLTVVPVAFRLANSTDESHADSTAPELGPSTAHSPPSKEIAGERRPPNLTQDQQRRLSLALWIANSSNPLPARVMANRIWQHHFGEGLVSTPSDFGNKGTKPTHPELLDWLASELRDAWSIKHLHRLIVTSATYRQSSTARTEAIAVDAATRLLWRFPPQRLEAEQLRDAILAFSGKLDLQPGGPGFSAFEPNDNYVRVYNPKKEFGPPEWRRMIYMTKIRLQQDSTFGAFDCPDGGQVTPKRTHSTTPLQALNLLNSNFILQQSLFFAERLEKEAGKNPEAQARRAFELSYGRGPDPLELKAAKTFITSHGTAVFCRALFNSNEFIFVE